MKLRWPMSPFEEPLMSSLSRSLPPPARPPAHASFSFSRLSSNNRAMLSRGMRLPLRDEAMQLGRRRRRDELLAEGLVAEHLRELREYLQMLVGRPVGHEQHEDEAHVLRIRGVERYWLARANERPDRVLETL